MEKNGRLSSRIDGIVDAIFTKYADEIFNRTLTYTEIVDLMGITDPETRQAVLAELDKETQKSPYYNAFWNI